MFFYFLPDAPRLSREELAKHSLAPILWDLLRDGESFDRITFAPVLGSGPNGSAGQLLFVAPPGGVPDGVKIGYFSGEQTWQQIGDVWIGFDKLPCPEELQRSFLLRGEEHVLGDANVWTCPVARRAGDNSLPQKWGVDKLGRFEMQTLPEYEMGWQTAQIAWDHVIGEAQLMKPEAFDICVKALSLNYRVGHAEISLLGLLNDTNYPLVFNALIDRAFWEDLLQAENSSKKD